MNATHLIERNTRAHTVDGYTAAHMVQAAHEKTIRLLVDELNTLKGIGAKPQAGCVHHACRLGDATVLVELEIEPAEGDGYNEPRIERSVVALQMLVNGTWTDVLDECADGFVAEYLKDEADACEQDKIDAHIANREWAAA